jgi:hypothetical protein
MARRRDARPQSAAAALDLLLGNVTADPPDERDGVEQALATVKDALEKRDAARWLDKAAQHLDAGYAGAAAMALANARLLGPDPERLKVLERRRLQLTRLPLGMKYLERDASRGTALYVGVAPVSNSAYKAWLEGAPAGTAVPWPAAGFAPAAASDPVKNVPATDAEAYAKSRGQRLPTADERAAIRRALEGVLEGESVATAGVFVAGFRTVQDPQPGDERLEHVDPGAETRDLGEADDEGPDEEDPS